MYAQFKHHRKPGTQNSQYYIEQVPNTYVSLNAPIPKIVLLHIPPALYHAISKRKILVLGKGKNCVKYMLKLQCLIVYFSTRVPLVVHTAEQVIEKFDFEEAQGEDKEGSISQNLIS